jgi:hypothetical protein
MGLFVLFRDVGSRLLTQLRKKDILTLQLVGEYASIIVQRAYEIFRKLVQAIKHSRLL